MTDTSHRFYAVALALVVFFVAWAAVAAKPWATAKADPRIAALAQREQRLRTDAKLVQRVTAQRMAAYQVALKHRRAQIAQAQAQIARAKVRSLQAASATTTAVQVAQPATPSVRIVNLPPITITRTS
jgi:hypothetical protein